MLVEYTSEYCFLQGFFGALIVLSKYKCVFGAEVVRCGLEIGAEMWVGKNLQSVRHAVPKRTSNICQRRAIIIWKRIM